MSQQRSSVLTSEIVAWYITRVISLQVTSSVVSYYGSRVDRRGGEEAVCRVVIIFRAKQTCVESGELRRFYPGELQCVLDAEAHLLGIFKTQRPALTVAT